MRIVIDIDPARAEDAARTIQSYASNPVAKAILAQLGIRIEE